MGIIAAEDEGDERRARFNDSQTKLTGEIVGERSGA